MIANRVHHHLRVTGDLFKAVRATVAELEGAYALAVVSQAEPQVAESFLSLHSSLRLKDDSKNAKVLLVTSTTPSEGKSFVASNLALTFAAHGDRTILVDCDLRRPSLHRIFDQKDVPGLSDLLLAPEQTFKSTRHLETFGLDFIPDGTEPPNPTHLLNSNRMREFLHREGRLKAQGPICQFVLL